MIFRDLYYLLPPKARFIARKLFFLPQDIFHKLYKGNEMLPPKGMIYTGSGDFVETGKRFINYFIEHGDLKEADHVLDIGSGIGRLAIPLTGFLSPKANYRGYDLIAQGVDWCTENITSKFPNFRFDQIHLKNDLYRNDGSEASTYSFPLDDASQDFVFLISVFTHMVPEEMENYISEIARLLQTNKTCFATFFILDKDKEENNSNFHFQYRHDHYALMDKKVKSANVAFDKNYLFNIISENHLEVVHYFPGHWRNPKSTTAHLDFQDILVFRKT